ncbi:MAG TPA: hypothetical protein VFL90_19950, partial [Methylomirabilota bacterium]|nr:hypothetical protein [Methylomirabilota bacterium]
MSRRRAGVWIVIAVTAAVVAAHFPIVFLGRTYVLRDALTFTLPARQFLARSLRAGHVPEW